MRNTDAICYDTTLPTNLCHNASSSLRDKLAWIFDADAVRDCLLTSSCYSAGKTASGSSPTNLPTLRTTCRKALQAGLSGKLSMKLSP